MTVHRFGDSLSIGKSAEDVFESLLKGSRVAYRNVSNNPSFQVEGIDFIIKVPSREIYCCYDVKNDAKASETGNIAIETASVIIDGEVKKDGWLYTSTADWIVYRFSNPDRFVFYTLEYLQRVVNETGNCRLVNNKGYKSEVVIVPLIQMRGITFHFREDYEDVRFLRALNATWRLTANESRNIL